MAGKHATKARDTAGTRISSFSDAQWDRARYGIADTARASDALQVDTGSLYPRCTASKTGMVAASGRCRKQPSHALSPRARQRQCLETVAWDQLLARWPGADAKDPEDRRQHFGDIVFPAVTCARELVYHRYPLTDPPSFLTASPWPVARGRALACARAPGSTKDGARMPRCCGTHRSAGVFGPPRARVCRRRERVAFSVRRPAGGTGRHDARADSTRGSIRPANLRATAARSSLPPILFGSHIDSVPSGGNFDGDLGSLAALGVIEACDRANHRTRHPLQMVVWSAEEGVAFGRGLAGSRIVAGDVKPADMDAVWNGLRRGTPSERSAARPPHHGRGAAQGRAPLLFECNRAGRTLESGAVTAASSRNRRVDRAVHPVSPLENLPARRRSGAAGRVIGAS